MDFGHSRSWETCRYLLVVVSSLHKVYSLWFRETARHVGEDMTAANPFSFAGGKVFPNYAATHDWVPGEHLFALTGVYPFIFNWSIPDTHHSTLFVYMYTGIVFMKDKSTVYSDIFSIYVYRHPKLHVNEKVLQVVAPWSIASLVCPTTFELYSSIEFPFSWCGRAFSLQCQFGCIKKLRSLLYMFWPKRVKLVPSALWGRGSSQKGWGWAIGHVTLATTINNLSERLDVSLASIAFNWISRLCWVCLQVYARLHTAFLNASAPCWKVCSSWIQFSSRFCSSNSNQWSEDVRSTQILNKFPEYFEQLNKICILF